jgi:PhzF family phenazine biosynthesis protein
MRQYILSSFVSKSGGGNKAAVVFDDLGLSEQQMLELARKNNFSETAFIDIKRSTENKFHIRYFTPSDEVDICGHAALAAFHVLKQLDYLNGKVAYHHTKAGELKVLLENDSIMIEMKKAELVMQLNINTILDIVDTGRDKIITNHNSMIDVISTGLKDIILEVENLETLREMNILRDNMIAVCNKYNLIGMHVVSRETIEKDSDFCCRNFAPAVGIDEESATGTSNASLLYYIMKNNDKFDYCKTYKVEQGYFMNSPSNIYMKAEKESDRIFVGGYVKIESIEEIIV